MNIENLKKKIQEANPELTQVKCKCCGFFKCDYSTTGCPWYEGRPIRLADVLLAIEARKLWPPYRIGTHGLFFVAKEVSATPRYISTGIQWNLKDDNLDNQSDECKEFLEKLLL